jgi:hypothetical protein
MPFWYERFGTTTLPIYEPKDEIGTAQARPGLVRTTGGFFAAVGSETLDADSKRIHIRRQIVETTSAALLTTYYALRALRGVRDKLYRRRDDQAVEWAYAWLVECDSTREPKNITVLTVDLTFELLSTQWYGAEHNAGWTFDSGEYFDTGLYFDSQDFLFTLDSSPKTVTVTNGGNDTVRNVIMTITAGALAITNLVIKRKVSSTTYEHLVYAGTIAAGESLVIDCGADSVENNGVGDYANFSRGASHQTNWLLQLLAGNNSIEVTITGGSTDSTILFTFSDGNK